MIPLVAPCITEGDRHYLRNRTFGDLLNDESEVAKFEEAFAARVNCAAAVAVCSGTVALELALDVLGDGPVVTVPTYACEALHTAFRLRLVDYSDSTYHVDTARLVQASGTVLVHAFGTPTRRSDDLDGAILEDWTLSLGAIPCLTGQLGVCSTHWSKMISTGRGGVIFGNDTGLLDEVRELASRRSVTLATPSAALGCSQLAQLDQFIERRRELAHTYSAWFQGAGIECPDPESGSVFFRYLIAVDNPASKVEALEARGVEAGRGVYPPLHRHANIPDSEFPGAMKSVNRLLSVPCHPSITDNQAQLIADRVVRVCGP